MDSSDDESLAGLTQVPSQNVTCAENTDSDEASELFDVQVDAARDCNALHKDLPPANENVEKSLGVCNETGDMSQDLFLTPPATSTPDVQPANISLSSNALLSLDKVAANAPTGDNMREKYVVETEDISDSEMCSVMDDFERSEKSVPLLPSKRPFPTSHAKDDDNRFKKPRSAAEMENLGKKKYSVATCTKIEWAMRAYNRWVDYRRKMYIGRVNNANPQQQWRPVDKLHKTWNEPLVLSRDVCDFIVEARKENGEEYPPGTIYDLVLMISLYLEREYGIDRLTTVSWPKIRNTLNAIMQERTAEGYGHTNERDYVSDQQEDFLWEEGYLGSDNPDKLRLTVFFLLGKNFALRGGSEHRDLVRYPSSQIKIESPDKDKIYLVYREFKSKTNQGGLSARNIKKPRVAYAFPNETNKERCPVALFIKYVRYCPIGTEESTAFYLRSNVKWETSKLWYTNQPIGKGQLNDYLKNLMSSAGFVGNYTNHSLRATAATRLFQANCPEQLIAEQTGHTSNAIRRYKKSNLAQKEEVSRLLAGGKSVDKIVEKSQDTKNERDSQSSSVEVLDTSVKDDAKQRDSKVDSPKTDENRTGTNVNVSVPNMQQNLSGLVNIHFHFNK